MTDDEVQDLTQAFFLESDSTQLERIHQWARARYAAPWAVFFGVLLRVATGVGPHVQLPGLIGGRASLNLMCIFVSASGGGKGISDKVARLAWPTEILELPIGSGEGIAATFKKPDKIDENNEPVTAALFMAPEIQTMAGIAGRQGSILLPQLKSAIMGEQLGQSNASKATSRVVDAHTYRCCWGMSAQPGHTGVVLDDTSGGTPQRTLWSPTTDPAMPDERTSDPEPLDTKLPPWAHHVDGIFEIQYGPDEIAHTIITAHLARQRGQADALDGHAMLTRCKVAAVMAIMHGRGVVSAWDWARSADVMAVSDGTREWVITEAQRAVRAKVRDRAVARATGDAIYDDRVLEGVKRSVVRMLERDGEQPGNVLRSRLGKREKRDLFDQAVALLEAEGLVSTHADEYNGARRVRYRIGSGLTSQVRPQRPSSEGVTPLVRPDQAATVTDLDTRRSPEETPRKLSCQEWFRGHVAGLRANDVQTVESFAVISAGERLGYARQSVISAAHKHPDVRVMARSGNDTTWCIDPTMTITYKPVGEWVTDYLDALHSDVVVVDKGHLREQGEAAGFTWPNIRNATRSHPAIAAEPSGDSPRAEHIWKIHRKDRAS